MNTQLTITSVSWKGMLCISLILILVFKVYSAKINSASSSGFSLLGNKKESKIKFELINNLIVVPIRLNNGKTTKAVIDTGIRSVILYGRKHRDELDFTNTRNIKINGLGKGKRQEGKLAVNNDLRIGDVVGEGIGIVSVGMEMPFEILNTNGVEAILGYQLFTNFIIEVDYIHNEITFHDPFYFSPNLEAHRFNIEVIDTKPYIITTIKVKYAHSEILAYNMKILIDTGAALDMAIYSNSKNARLFMINPSDKVRIGQGMNGEIGGYKSNNINIDVGDISLYNISISIIDRKSGKKYSNHYGVDGLIGGNVLKQYKVTFDYINGDVYLESPNM